jgi:hypothetical protein
MRDVKNAMDRNGKDWWVGHHHGFGMGVRNLLREGGFEWNPIDMDDLWVGLVERAVNISPKCGAKMQRVYKRDNSRFVSISWVCTDCGLFKKDN